MQYLDHEAADSFYVLSVRSFDLKLIGRADLEMRLACLCNLVNPHDELFAPLRCGIPPSLAHEIDHIDEELSEVTVTREEYNRQQMRPASSWRSVLQPPAMQLVVQGVSGMKKWVFHEYDADPYPSVPHGHEEGKAHPKCDPYTGRVYDAHRREITRARLSRKTRIALWREPKFREFALKAIIWYGDQNPYYSFRVRHPKRLPKFRQN